MSDPGAELVVVEAALAFMAHDLDRGLVPVGVTRPLHPHELAARTNFAELDDEVERAAGRLAGVLHDYRAGFVDLLEADLAAQGDVRGLGERLRSFIDPAQRAPVAGVHDLTDQAIVRLRAELDPILQAGAERLYAEAQAQGVPITPRLGRPALVIDEDVAMRLDARAGGTVAQVGSRALDVAQGVASREPIYDLELGEAARRVAGGVRTASTAGLEDLAQSAASNTYGVGRQSAAAQVPQVARIYASELLDRNTCRPCNRVDGTEYPSQQAAEVDYPRAEGRYRDCLGGPRCRGTLVWVWSSEEPPSIDDPSPPLPPEPPEPPPGPVAPDVPGDGSPAPAPDADLGRRVDELRRQTPADWYPPEPSMSGLSHEEWIARRDAVLAERRSNEELVRSAGQLVDDRAQELLAQLDVPSVAEVDVVRDAAYARIAELDDELGRTSRTIRARFDTSTHEGRQGMLDALENDPERVRIKAEREAARVEWHRAQDLRVAVQEAASVAQGEAYRQALREAGVELGPTAGAGRGAKGRWHDYTSGSSVRDGIDHVEAALDSYPTRWLVRSRDAGPIKVGHRERGFYKPSRTPELNLSGRNPFENRRTAYHELGHRMEHVLPDVRALESVFYRRRTSLADGTLARREHMGPGYGPREVTRPDDFVERYMGKAYDVEPTPGQFYELLSTGMEGLFHGAYGGLAGDVDFRRFLLGLLSLV